MTKTESPFHPVNDAALTIHDLKIRTYDPASRKYPVEISSTRLGRYSRLERAEQVMGESIASSESRNTYQYKKIHSFSVTTFRIDVPDCESFVERRVYDEHGNLYGIEKNDDEPFLGKDPVECRFEKKEIVEFLYAHKLDVGIVFGQPLTPGKVKSVNKKLWDKLQLRCDQSDNTYLIDTGWNDCDHHHLPECSLFKPRLPIRKAKRRKLIEHYDYLHNIYLRYGKEHVSMKSAELQMNSYMLSKIKEPHVIIYNVHQHLVVSLASNRIIRGNPRKFDREDLERVFRLIQEMNEKLHQDFHDMSARCR